jgi:hypothetical protein
LTTKLSKRKNALNKPLIFAALAFLIPLISRAVPEILMGQYVVGFDAMGYYIPNTLEWLRNGVTLFTFISSAPLIYVLLMGTTSAGVSIVISIKVLAPLILGLLGLTLYFFAYKGLSWSSKKSLLVAVLATLYFVSLRISWDMLRSEIGLIFLLLVLIVFQKNKISIKNAILLTALMVLIVFTHQLVTVIMFAVLIATLVSFYLRKKTAELGKLVACAAPATLLFFAIIYINYFVYSEPILGVSGNFSGGFEILTLASHADLIVNMFGFLAFCYLPLLPLLIFSVKHFRKSNLQLKAWILWLFIPLLLVIISSNFYSLGGVLPFRWILLLTYPLAFYAVDGLSRIKWNWYKAGAGLILAIILATLSTGFMTLPNNQAFSYFGYFPQYIPKTMLQNTVPLSDCQDTNNALYWVKNNMPRTGHLIVHEAFYGWAELTLNSNQIVPYYFGTPETAAQKLQNTSSSPVYLIWWVHGVGWYGQQSVPASFTELYSSGNIAIYNYSAPS